MSLNAAQNITIAYSSSAVPRDEHLIKANVQHLSGHDTVQVQYRRRRRAQLLAEDVESSTPPSRVIFGEPNRRVWTNTRTSEREILEATRVVHTVKLKKTFQWLWQGARVLGTRNR